MKMTLSHEMNSTLDAAASASAALPPSLSSSSSTGGEDPLSLSLLWDVIVVGAGVAGCSAAYHLHQTTGKVESMLILDSGDKAGEGIAPRRSGSATMKEAGCVKMMVQVYAGSSADMIKHHGPQGASQYLQATRRGLELQKKIAKEIWKDDYTTHMRELGSYYVGYAADREELRKEYDTLKQLGCDDIEWCDKERLKEVVGLCQTDFECGIYFPKDAIIDSSKYAKTLLQYVINQSQGKTHFRPCSTVQNIQEDNQGVQVQLASGEIIRGNRLVVATGALFPDPMLSGILMPCYSYLVHLPISTQTDCEFSPNFFTWGFSHDWCFVNGKIRVSGEDHFSAYKAPRAPERCTRLSKWTLRRYGCDFEDSDVASLPQQYGLYSETPDMVPLVGPIRDGSRICYLLGCNAWGQTILSSCASLLPGVMGYAELDEEQRGTFDLVSIQRFEHLPSGQVK
jgi:glycine/D-amino acid oxidase-like deaminating enzyme